MHSMNDLLMGGRNHPTLSDLEKKIDIIKNKDEISCKEQRDLLYLQKMVLCYLDGDIQ